jgi:hypothetical protein
VVTPSSASGYSAVPVSSTVSSAPALALVELGLGQVGHLGGVDLDVVAEALGALGLLGVVVLLARLERSRRRGG